MFKNGTPVKVVKSLLYTGRKGVIAPTSDEPDDPWDYNVILDATDEDPEPNRRIGVFDIQVELIK